MLFRKFIKNRKALIGLIAAFTAVLAALIGIWLYLSRIGRTTDDTLMQNTTQPTTMDHPSSGQTDPADSASVPSGDVSDDTTGMVPTLPEPSEPTHPEASEPVQPNTPSSLPEGAAKPGSSGVPPQSDGNGYQETDSLKPEKELLSCDNFSLYSGQYVEDGRDELVTNVAAVLVTNRSTQFLDLATLTFQIDGREATFRVSGLPAGRSAWVLEASRMTATNSSTFTFVDMVTGFKENVISSTDKLSITCVGNLVTATNKSEKKLENVFVYYRVLHSDGNYLGGITYVIDFGTLEPGQSVEKLAGHFSAEKARIVRIGWSGQ